MSNKNIIEYKDRVDKMQSYLKIAVVPSSHSIYIYLYIYGKLTYIDLMAKLNYSRGTIFTSLKVLQEADLISKHEDPSINDKRKNVFYSANKVSIDIDIDQPFLNYLIQFDYIETYIEYVKLSQTFSLSMMSVAVEIFQNKGTAYLKEALANKTSEQIEETHNRDVGQPNLFYYEIKSLKDRKKITKMLHECIEKFEQETHKTVKEGDKPIQDPVILSVVFAGLT